MAAPVTSASYVTSDKSGVERAVIVLIAEPMTKLTSTLIVAALLAACGSKSKPTTMTTATTTTTTTDDQGSGSAVAVVDKPADKPADPPPPDTTKMKADLLAAESAAYEKAKPVFEKNCANCHTKAGKKSSAKKLGHMDMGTYPFGGEHTASIGNEIRKVLGIDGAKPTMPFDKPGSVKGDDLATIKAWTEAWQAAGAAGVHPAEPADND